MEAIGERILATRDSSSTLSGGAQHRGFPPEASR
jgi:hypothetical protein